MGYYNNLLNSNFSVNLLPTDRSAESRLKNLLQLLRITASIHNIDEWTKNDDFKRHSWVLKQFTSGGNAGTGSDFANDDPMANVLTDENINRSKMYMQK